MTIKALRSLWGQAFGDTEEFMDGFFRAGFCEDRCRFIEREGKLATALYWFDCLWENKKVAYIYGVATDKAFRGQGLCRRLMEDTHKHLQAAGYVGAALVPAGAGLGEMYGKMGYRGFCPMESKTVSAGDAPADVRRILPEEYAQLRVQRLPAGSIQQGQDTLAFYATYGEFYRCGHGIFCAARENETLYIQEFLGNPESLPGIVAALDCSSAQVRLSGGDKNFAMYRSFTNEEELPAYLGLTLD